MHKQRGFSLLEILVVIGIIALLSAIVFTSLFLARDKARDTKRIADISQIGKYLTLSCYKPAGSITSMDLIDVANEIVLTNPSAAKFLGAIPKDPKTGTTLVSNYTYVVSLDGSQCALVTNLENVDAEIDLTSINVPTPGGGQGIFQGLVIGPNGTDIYYQFSN